MPEDRSPRRSETGAQAIHRAMHIVRLLANNAGAGMRLTDIAGKLGLYLSTTHRILAALEAEGVVERVRKTRRYTIGSELVWLGLGASSRFPIAAAAPALDRLSAEVGDAVFLTVRSGEDSVCADRRIGTYPIQVLSIAVGSRRPLGISQGGRAILAFLPAGVAQKVMAANAARYAEHGCDPDVLAASIADARRVGYICSDGVTVRHTRVIAVPVLDAAGIAIAAISVIAIRSRLPQGRIPGLVNVLQATSKDIAHVLEETKKGRVQKSY